MDKKTEALKLALEALEIERNVPRLGPVPTKTSKAITALREALASEAKEQPAQQEPVAKVYRHGRSSNGTPWHGVHWFDEGVNMPDGTLLYTTPQAQPAQQEPVAWLRKSDLVELRACNYMRLGADSPSIWAPNAPDEPSPDMELVAVYTSPPAQRKPLTDEQLRKVHHEDQFGLFCDYDEFEQIARAIEAAHDIKGDA